MKRIICILLTVSAMILICSGGTADQHYAIQGVFNGHSGGKIVSFDIYEQDGSIITVSSLFPDFAIENKTGKLVSPLSEMDWIFRISPELINHAIEKTEYISNEWFTLHPPEITDGLYSGDLFENASKMKQYEFNLHDYIDFFTEYLKKAETDNNDPANRFLSSLILSLSEWTADNDPTICIKTYTDDLYLSILVIDRDDVVLTLSVDRSAMKNYRILVSWRSNGLYCFRDVSVNHSQPFDISFLSSVYIGRFSAYPMYKNKSPLFSENVRMITEADGSCSFQFAFESAKLKNPLLGKGSISGFRNGYEEITACIYIDGSDSETIDFSIYPDDISRAVSFTDKKMIHTDSVADVQEIRTAVIAGIMSLAAEIIVTIPPDYQKLITDLLLK